MRSTVLALSLLAAATSCQKHEAEATPKPTPVERGKPAVAPRPDPVTKIARDDRMYTTYFYTAAEAVVHGYEKDTQVRIVSLADPATQRKAGTIWQGTVGVGETKLVPTGPGVFGLLSDKKAAILVGTPVGLHFAFDSRACRLVEAWRGAFVDAAGAWSGRGGMNVEGRGPVIWKAPTGPPLEVTLNFACVSLILLSLISVICTFAPASTKCPTRY